MSQISLSGVFQELFFTPLEAVTKAEDDYRKVWGKWIKTTLPLYKSDGELSAEDINQMLNLAPIVKLDGVIEVGMTVRIAEMKKREGGVQGGIQVGPVYASGNFGFVNQRSTESVIQASTRFTVSNHQGSLSDYLAERNLTPSSRQELEAVANQLESDTDAKQ